MFKTVLTSNVMAYGEEPLEVLNVRSWGWTLIIIRRREPGIPHICLSFSFCCISLSSYNPRRVPSPETHLVATLVFDLQSPELGGSKFHLFEEAGYGILFSWLRYLISVVFRDIVSRHSSMLIVIASPFWGLSMTWYMGHVIVVITQHGQMADHMTL